MNGYSDFTDDQLAAALKHTRARLGLAARVTHCNLKDARYRVLVGQVAELDAEQRRRARVA